MTTPHENRTAQCFAVTPSWSRGAKKGEVPFCLLGTNGSHAKSKNERRSRMNLLLQN